MKKAFFIAAVIAVVLMLGACAAGPNTLEDQADENGKVAGFFSGLWHGFIALFTFIISIFTDKVNVYDVNNSGILYNLGFIIGVSAFFGGSGGAGGRRVCRRSRDE
ncbi:MAG: hypothetical protein JW874_14195 [Spirochaetales bacterium]|nr:hypothetical protein [Spirochaetales bacterium]